MVASPDIFGDRWRLKHEAPCLVPFRRRLSAFATGEACEPAGRGGTLLRPRSCVAGDEPRQRCRASEDENEVSRATVADHVGRTIDGLVCAAARGRTDFADQLVNDRISDRRNMDD